jgi:hypothetical protein
MISSEEIDRMLSYTIDQLDAIRVAELRLLMQKHEGLFSGANILEIGTGTGAQLRELSKVPASAIGLDLRSSDYQPRCSNFTYYDGVNFPSPIGHSTSFIPRIPWSTSWMSPHSTPNL